MLVPSDTRFIYIHGFNSSPESFKAQQLKSWFAKQGAQDQLFIPELHHRPRRALGQLKRLVEGASDVMLIGSSLGGFYATWLADHYDQVRAVLVNPAVAPHKLLCELLGETENYHTGERYQLTLEHMSQLESLFIDAPEHPERLLLLQQEGDETLDYREAVRYYTESSQIVQPGGSHAFDNFEQLLAPIMDFASDQLDPQWLTHSPQG